MKTLIKQLTRLFCFIFITFGSASCKSEETETQLVSPDAKAKSITEQQPIQKSGEPNKAQLFEDFYTEFSKAVDTDNWNKVVNLTHFPFTFRGQLDNEGEIKLDEKEFLQAFPKFLEQEAFINVDDMTVPTTWRGLLMTRMAEAESISDSTANIHDFVFKLVDSKWKLVQVYSDLSTVRASME